MPLYDVFSSQLRVPQADPRVRSPVKLLAQQQQQQQTGRRERVRHYTALGWERKLRRKRRSQTPVPTGSCEGLSDGAVVSYQRTGTWLPGLGQDAPSSLRPERVSTAPAAIPGRETERVSTGLREVVRPARRIKDALHGTSTLGISPPLLIKASGEGLSTSPISDLPTAQHRSLYRQWAGSAESESACFTSVGVWAEIVLLQVYKLTSHIPSPNQLRTAVCCLLLTKLCKSFGKMRGVLNIITTEIFNALYRGHEVDLTARVKQDTAPGSLNTRSETEAEEQGAPCFINLTLYSTLYEKTKRQEQLLRQQTAHDGDVMADAVRVASLQSEVADLKKDLVRLHLRAWRRVCKPDQGGDDGLVAVIQACKNRETLRRAFRQWRVGVRLSSELKSAALARRLGVQRRREVASPVTSDHEMEDSMRLDEPGGKFMLPSQLSRAKRDKLPEMQHSHLTIRREGSRSPVEETAPETKESGAAPDTPRFLDALKASDIDECSSLTAEAVLMPWLRDRLKERGVVVVAADAQAELTCSPRTSKRQWPPQAPEDLCGEAFTELTEALGVATTRDAHEDVSSAALAAREAAFNFPSLPVSDDDFASGNTPVLLLLLLAYFGLWLKLSPGAETGLSAHLGFVPGRGPLLDAMRDAVSLRLLSGYAPRQTSFAGMPETRLALLAPQVRDVVARNSDLLVAAFDRCRESENLVGLQQLSEFVLGTGAMDDVEPVVLAGLFVLNLPAGAHVDLRNAGSGLSCDEFADTLLWLSQWCCGEPASTPLTSPTCVLSPKLAPSIACAASAFFDQYLS